MNLPPDQLKIRLEAAIATLKRLDDPADLSEETYTALCRARWYLAAELVHLEFGDRPRTAAR